LLLLAGQAATFEVASVKRNLSIGTDGGMHVEPGGRYFATNLGVFPLVAVAYGESMNALRPSQIIGAPGWLESEHYDIVAKAANPADMDDFDKTRLLLRALLADRFKLRVHREQRRMPIYALVPARAGVLGPNLKQSIPDCLAPSSGCGFRGGPVNHIKGDAIPMAILVQLLTNVTGRIVVDRTGLKGGYQIDLEYSPDQAASDKPSIFTAVQEQLGLKLEAARGSVDVVVIDHVERPAED
ncbi:MAG TPA: TIGR03435 family protein, partial [Vicinamibacterales bacterium]|nr:TIGR03435 family protein [Vicinamibacterales bacterium]